jgi:hypothetical protein
MWRKVDDRQAAMAKPYLGFSISPDAMVIRATMRDHARHLLEQRCVNGTGRD